MFQTIVHPTDFDEPSLEAFRVARSLARSTGARVVVFHVVAPPAIVTQDGKVLDPHGGEPADLWAGYRVHHANDPALAVQYAVVVGDRFEARWLLEEKVRELGEGVLVVMGTHGRRGLSWLLWGSKAEEVVRECPCPVLVVKAPAPKQPTPEVAVESVASA